MSNYMANRRSPKSKLTKEELSELRADNGSKCSLCCKHDNQRNLVADHITPLRSGGFDVPSNIQFICNGCNVLVKRSIRIPVSLANEAVAVSKLPLAEVVRASMQYYMQFKLDDGHDIGVISDFRKRISQLENKNRRYVEQIKLIEEALKHNPYRKYSQKQVGYHKHQKLSR